MRDMIFRVWDKETRKFRCKWEADCKASIVDLGYFNLNFFINNDRYIIQQYTGLKDKNGKEIYEGDIVKYKHTRGFDAEAYYKYNKEETMEMIKEVEYRRGEFVPRETGSFPDDGYYAWRTWDIEVIGNKYENPELLED